MTATLTANPRGMPRQRRPAMIVIVAIVIAALLAGILVYVAMRPGDFLVQRSLAMQAPPERIFALIDDFHRWGAWSPYEKLDPAMQRRLSGALSGKGAVYEWNGNGKAGSGRMEIIDSAAPGKVVIKLDFIKPFEGHNTAEFTLDRHDDVTTVTWAMRGPMPFVAKLMSVFVNMDRMIGKEFENGLANLKTLAEQA